MYSTDHTDVINKNIKKLEDKANEYVMINQEPNVEERNASRKVIKEFIKKKNRIVYGGYAQNSLIKEKNEGDQFYGKFDFPDIEFYTPEPAKDAMELSNILYAKKFKDIRLEQGVHDGTYKIFVNFENVCDIGYIPNNINNNYPNVMIEGMKMTPPELVYIDTLRVYNDPLNSWFRLNKTWTRSNILLRYYPLKLKSNDSRLRLKNDLPNKIYEEVFRFIRKELLHNTKRIVIGHYGYNYLVKKTELTDLVLSKIPFYQIITGNYEHDVRKIDDILRKKFGDKIKSEEFYPFFEFLGRRTEFYYEKQVILKVYHHNNRCIVYQKSEKKNTYFGRYSLIIMHLLMDYLYFHVNRLNIQKNNHAILLNNLIDARNNYLKTHNMTPLDKSPFQEFTIDCFGTTISPLRKSRLDLVERVKKGKRAKFTYNPTGKTAKPPNIIYPNVSGNRIKNDKYNVVKNRSMKIK
jgi:hypothetical protein